jgi:8-oxo-dGTP pyrophosphatase MutT (NUDIX family)
MSSSPRGGRQDIGKAAGAVPGKATGSTPKSASIARPPRTGREVSAGGVVVRDGEVLVIVPSRRASDGSLVLALPKGHPDGQESTLAAATREVREETGVTAEPVCELGEVRYWYMREGRRIPKSVFFYLFRYLSGDPADHDHEVLQARWMPLEEARRALTYAGERDVVGRALAISTEDR